MRPLALLLPAGVLALAVAGIAMGGRQIAQRDTVAEIEPVAEQPAPTVQPMAPIMVEPPYPPTAGITPPTSRQVGPVLVAPPAADETVERDAPRPPLSRLSLALPPKADLARGSKLFRPVAVEAGVVEATGRRVAIAGVVSVPPDETCDYGGASWNCGVNARTAFRLWLRGRALDCDMPDTADRNLIVASCRMGKQDAGAWLVSNGWARAVAGGPYADLGREAEAAGRGIFGRPPDTGGLPNVPDMPAIVPQPDQPVLAMPPADLPEPAE